MIVGPTTFFTTCNDWKNRFCSPQPFYFSHPPSIWLISLHNSLPRATTPTKESDRDRKQNHKQTKYFPQCEISEIFNSVYLQSNEIVAIDTIRLSWFCGIRNRSWAWNGSVYTNDDIRFESERLEKIDIFVFCHFRLFSIHL